MNGGGGKKKKKKKPAERDDGAPPPRDAADGERRAGDGAISIDETNRLRESLGLDVSTQARIADLQAEHDNNVFLAAIKADGASDADLEKLREKYPPTTHPVVRTHPISGRKSIYVNKIFTRRIEGLSERESQALLEQLYRQAWIPDFQCRFRWRQDSLAFWDNRGAQHYAAADYWPERRAMERVTIMGDRPR